jgi:hypothetical protein
MTAYGVPHNLLNSTDGFQPANSSKKVNLFMEQEVIKNSEHIPYNGWVRYLLADTLPAFPQESDQLQVAGLCILAAR